MSLIVLPLHALLLFAVLLPPCPVGTEITVTFDPDPVFTWDPGCGGSVFLIEPEGEPEDMWAIEAFIGFEIVSPLSYGVSPPGTFVHSPPQVLEPGVTYEVTLFSFEGASLSTFTVPGAVATAPCSWATLKASWR